MVRTMNKMMEEKTKGGENKDETLPRDGIRGKELIKFF